MAAGLHKMWRLQWDHLQTMAYTASTIKHLDAKMMRNDAKVLKSGLEL